VRRQVWVVDEGQPLCDPKTVEDIVADSFASTCNPLNRDPTMIEQSRPTRDRKSSILTTMCKCVRWNLPTHRYLEAEVLASNVAAIVRLIVGGTAPQAHLAVTLAMKRNRPPLHNRS
jgi:hypothetical protein